MRLSSMADYAIVLMIAASRHCGGARVNAGLLAEETGLPAPTVQKLVSRLSAAGLIKSVRGAGGGFKLARPAAAISLADIVEAVEGPIALAACMEGLRPDRVGTDKARADKARADRARADRGHDCTLEAGCSLRPHWPVVNDALRGALAGVPLTRLAAPPSPVAPNLSASPAPSLSTATPAATATAGVPA